MGWTVFFMRRLQKIRPWEWVLLAAVLAVLTCAAWLHGEQRALADQVLRLHVIANSDGAEDQATKLAVRDRILAEAEQLCPAGASQAEARAALADHLDDLAAAGQEVVDARGSEDRVTATLTRCWFPTKAYRGFALPAGEYEALRIVIGAGEGHNWWCVAFPPLCTGAASETVDTARAAGLFTDGQARLVTGDGGGYVLKFKSMELLGELEGWLRGK